MIICEEGWHEIIKSVIPLLFERYVLYLLFLTDLNVLICSFVLLFKIITVTHMFHVKPSFIHLSTG